MAIQHHVWLKQKETATTEDIENLQEVLKKDKIGSRKLNVEYAFHSESVDLIKTEFEKKS